ncbi:type VII secretion protein EccB [Streptomyces sp. NBC_01476]|uniref:type VII secretion protein EccB n=1 Tax=Streptomyces sp. NBC_01476 TaxID=2903881 RepID=UPI002E341AAE|nr:type VII secretion protein EccB [Streptomyces sp. NBC_01476]
MQTRRDHLQAYQFAVGRMATALVTGDPGRGTGPTRRGTLGTYFGVLLVVLLCAGFGVYGLIKPVQKDTWRQPGSIIVEKETGNRYLMVDGSLRPVLNYASALLLTGSSGTVRTVSRGVLSEVPHGGPVGIPDAPDSLPAAGDVLSGGWARCLRPGGLGEVLDLAPAHMAKVPAGAQAVLTSGRGTRYVLYQSVKYPVPDSSVLIALGLDGGEQLAAPDSWLARVPTGPALAAPTVPQAGRAAGTVAGEAVRVGQLFRTPADAGGHTYVMLSDGIAPVTATQAALLAARPGAGAVRTVDATAVAASPVSPTGLPGSDLPNLLHAPQARTGGAALCLRQIPSGAQLSMQTILEYGTAGTTTRRVLVPPGHGLLVLDQDQIRAGNRNSRSYLVDDQGILYSLGDTGAAPALRLSGPSTAMPEDVMALLRRGPVLDAETAAADAPASSAPVAGTNGTAATRSSVILPAVPGKASQSSYGGDVRGVVAAVYAGPPRGPATAPPGAGVEPANGPARHGTADDGKGGKRR